MNDWFEIFRAGTWTDSQGRTREWTETDLDRVAATYDPATQEAPLVIGHPQTNHPAYGWVEAVKRDGRALLARAKQVVPQFAEAVKQGLYKKRSISLYPDGRLRHVGFLGAAPPAVPGLADLTFAEGDEAETIEFTTSDEETRDMKTIEELTQELAAERAAREAAEKTAAKAAADFAEGQRQTRRKDLSDWVAVLEKDGRALPAWREQGMGIVEFLTQIDAVAEYEFAAPDGTRKTETPAAWFRSFVESFSAHPLFKDMTRPAGDAKAGEAADFTECLTDRV